MAARTWSSATAKNWSDPTAWDGGISVPATTDTITFSNAGIGNCNINNIGTWSGGSITIAGTYTGTITQERSLVVGAYSQTATVANTWDTAGFAFTCTTFALVSGTHTQNDSTITTGAVSLTGGTLNATMVTWNLGGSWTQSGSTSTFNANGGTINVTAAATITDTRSTFNLVTINAGAGVTIAAGTTCPLGASPTSAVGAANELTVQGVITFSGAWTHTSALNLNSTGTINGTSGPTLTLSGYLFIDPSGTVTNAISTITFNAAGVTQTLTDTGDKLSGTTFVINQTSTGATTVAASTTMRLGATPTSSTGTGSLTVTGTLSFSGAMTHTGTITGAGTITGTSNPVVTIIEGAATFTNITFTNPIGVTMRQTSATGRTFAGAGKTYGAFNRGGTGSGTLTISGSNTFTTFNDGPGATAHTLTFTAGTTQTATDFGLGGSPGSILTIISSSAGSAATLHTTGTSAIVAEYSSIKDSTVDASPVWYYGAGSSLVSGTTNWISGGGGIGSAGFGTIILHRRRGR